MSRFNSYPNYQDTSIDWAGKIPSHWNEGRVRDVTQILNGAPFSSDFFDPDGGTPLVRIRDILNKAPQIGYTGPLDGAVWIKDGDILIGMDGDYNVAWWRGGDALLNQRVAALRAQDDIDQRFLYYLLPFPLKILNDLAFFTTVRHLSSFQIGKIRFPLPLKEEQQKIAQFLDYQTDKIDRLIEKQRRLIGLLEEKRQEVVNSGVTGGFSKSSDWQRVDHPHLGSLPKKCTALEFLDTSFDY